MEGMHLAQLSKFAGKETGQAREICPGSCNQKAEVRVKQCLNSPVLLPIQ